MVMANKYAYKLNPLKIEQKNGNQTTLFNLATD